MDVTSEPRSETEDAARHDALSAVASRYAVAITPAMEALIDGADPADPIARQFRPSAAELVTRPEESGDPIGDQAHSPVEGIVHRYPDRVLLKPVHVCAVYCRFCFRREMVGPGGERALSAEALQRALDYIRADAGIWEVILTGGDPLVLSPRRLGALMRDLLAIPHVKVVRLHSRVPVVAPERITDALLQALDPGEKAVYLVIHANHARELTPASREAARRLGWAGIALLSQSVLLRGVNDDPASLEALMRALVESRIKPYYLHHGDLAPGTSHFRTGIQDGQALMRDLQGRVSGLCQPTYVLDIPGGHGKAPIGPSYLADLGGGRYRVADYRGGTHPYTISPAERTEEGGG